MKKQRNYLLLKTNKENVCNNRFEDTGPQALMDSGPRKNGSQWSEPCDCLSLWLL